MLPILKKCCQFDPSLCVSLLKNLWHRVNRTVGCSDCTIRKAKSKIFKNWQTAWTVQSFGLQTAWTANSPKRPDRPKSWYCPNRLNSSGRANSPNSCLWFGLKFTKLRRLGAIFLDSDIYDWKSTFFSWVH